LSAAEKAALTFYTRFAVTSCGLSGQQFYLATERWR
jgi:hypothetical protein